MAGHSKWSNIKHRKGAQDAKRGKIFTKIIKEITVSVKIGGVDIDSNSRLRKAIQNAKSNNMPLENIKRAIKKASGMNPGAKYEEVIYEGYGPFGVAIMLEVITDNKNRSVAEIRHAFSKFGGKLGENGTVAWIFEKKGKIVLKLSNSNEDDLYEVALKIGAEDIDKIGNEYIIKIPPENICDVEKIFNKSKFNILYNDIEMIPNTYQIINEDELKNITDLLEFLSKIEDINNIYSNLQTNV